MATVLLLEDEVNIASFIERGLKESGHMVTIANDGKKGWEEIENHSFDLLIVDIIMPEINGLDLCKRYREFYGYQTPVIMLTALGTTEDIVKGLEAGADDYLTKPFSFKELEARIKALIRRNQPCETSAQLVCGSLLLNCDTRHAERNGINIDLTVKEYRLLKYFMMNQDKVVTRMDLLRNVWDKNFDTNTNVVDVYVNYLRSKIDKEFDEKLLHTIVGAGYMLKADQ